MRKLLLILLTLLVIAGVLLAPSYLRYRQTRGAVPPGVRVGGLDFGSATAESVTEALTRQFAEPVAVYYADQRILLRPQMLGFQVDVPAMLAEAQAHETPGHLLRLWVGEAMHQPPPPVEVPLRYKLDRDQMDVWLTDIAARYDRAPSPARALSVASGIAPGKPGWQLDIPASRLRVVTALTDPHTRTANLAVSETMPPPMDMKLLAELLRERSEQFPGVVGIFLQHIPSGEQLAINDDVAYSGMGTMKLVILEELFRKLNASPDPQTRALISETVSMAGTRSANELLALIGDSDAAAGVNALNASMRKLGLKSTFMAAPYDQAGPRVTTPANSRSDVDTRPDPNIQTTPREIGMVMQMLVECEQGGGTLLAAYGGQITQAECQKILETLKLNEITALILSGLPEGTRAVHRHGYTSDTEGDVAVIWGPTGPYVLSIFLYKPSWLEWDFASETMGDLSRIVWSYFTLASQQ
jgi:hypothetical protein